MTLTCTILLVPEICDIGVGSPVVPELSLLRTISAPIKSCSFLVLLVMNNIKFMKLIARHDITEIVLKVVLNTIPH